MGGDAEVLIARQLTVLLTNRGQFEQLEDVYCRLRHDRSPTAALDGALAELLPASERRAVTAFISGEGDEADSAGGLPPVHHSLIDGLEDRYEQRQTSERQARWESVDTGDLAADVANDAQLAHAHRERRREAATWLERFPAMVRERASSSPTPTGRRLVVDQALKALRSTQTYYEARHGDDAEAQVAWCVALRDRLTAGGRDRGDAPAEQSFRARPRDELGDRVGTASKSPASTTPAPTLLDPLRSATSSLGDEDGFIALIEAANGHDDDYDPTDQTTLQAMESLLDEEVIESGDNPLPHVGGRVRNELWAHMVSGYRVGRYLLATHGRRPSPSARASRSYAASDLISYVVQAHRRQDVRDVMSAPDFSAALHYHGLSSSLLQACGGDRPLARARVRLAEDLGFLTALGAEDLTRGSTLQASEPRPPAGDGPAVRLRGPSRPIDAASRVRGR